MAELIPHLFCGRANMEVVIWPLGRITAFLGYCFGQNALPTELS